MLTVVEAVRLVVDDPLAVVVLDCRRLVLDLSREGMRAVERSHAVTAAAHG